MSRREYAGAAASTTLAGAITPTDLTITLASAPGWPDGAVGPFLIVINRGEADEEKVLVTSRTTTSLTVASLGHRGFDDTTAVAHDAGATVEHCVGAIDFDEANDHINNTGLDHHTQYLNTDRHGALSHTTAMLADGAVTSAKLVTAQRAEPGDIKLTARSTPSTGWLLCDGSAVSRTTYANLFAAIGETFGEGDGSTTFNVPDLRGRAPVGAGTGVGLTARALGDEFGSETVNTSDHTHTGPSHTHTINAHTHTGPSHTHTISGTTGPTTANHTHQYQGGGTGDTIRTTDGQSTEHAHSWGGTTSASGTGSTSSVGLTTNSAGTGSTSSDGGETLTTGQPALALNFVIKT